MPSEPEVRNELNRILESPGFRNSERLIRFLRFTVEAKLKGEAGAIKEYLVGREVFDRGEDYDPRIDPIVRVEARRLRKKLDDYYAAAPAHPGSLRIAFPKGSYNPEFELLAEAPDAAAVRPSRRAIWLGAGAVVSGAMASGAAAWLWFRVPRTPTPSVAVIPARWIWRSNDFSASPYDEDLAELTAAELALRGVPVTAWPALQKFRSESTLERIAGGVRAGRALMVSVRVEADGFRVTAYLVDPLTNRKLGVSDLPAQRLETREQRLEVARALASAASARR